MVSIEPPTPAAIPRVLWAQGSAARGVALTIRAPATKPVPCPEGLRERRDAYGKDTARPLAGYTLAPPAANPFVGPRVYPRPSPVDRFLYNLQCFVRVRYTKHCVLQGFGPLGGREFHLGDVKKRRFFHGFCFAGRKNRKKLYRKIFLNINCLKSPQHRPNIANIASKMAQHRANICQHGANIRQHRPNIGPT